MNIVIAGGTGFIGTAVVERLLKEGHTVVLLTRNPAKHPLTDPHIAVAAWDGKSVGAWARHLESSDGIINLAGESLGSGRWTPARKERLLASRIDPTRALVGAIAAARRKPAVLINASAAGYYGSVESGDVTEEAPQGSGFLASLVAHWEGEAQGALGHGLRVVTPRFGLVLDRDGGALPKLALPFRFFAGGWLGSGRQWFPWVHRDDVARAVVAALTDARFSGAVNLAAPEAVTNKQFCKLLGSVLHRSCWAPAPAPLLRLALGEMAGMLLTGQKMVPARLRAMDFRFSFPALREALEEIFSR